jgi:hypothetical protein
MISTAKPHSVMPIVVAVLGLSLIPTPWLLAQQDRSVDTMTAEQAYKNIQVLKGTPASELGASMHLISGALHVECGHCHVEPNQFDKDDKPAKQVAREMIVLVQQLNKTYFQGKQVVSCYTCHHGNLTPIDKPILPVAPYAQEAPPSQLPSADQLLSKYVQALGGEQALRRVKTRVITATQDIPTGPGGVNMVPGETVQYLKAPNLALTLSKYGPPNRTLTISSGFDGSRAWTQNAQGRVTEPLEIDQKRTGRASDFYQSLDLKQQYSKLEVSGREQVDGHEAYRVVAEVPDDLPERVYFDVESGLLVRKETDLPTPVGLSPYRVDYGDYRDVGGVKVPFLITMTPSSPRTELVVRSVMRVQKVEDNVPIDNDRFTKPQP